MIKSSLFLFALAACLVLAACGSANNGASSTQALRRGLQNRAVTTPAVAKTGAMPLKRSLAATDYAPADEDGGDPENGNNGDDAGGVPSGPSDVYRNPGGADGDDQSQASSNGGAGTSMDCDPARLGCSTGTTCNNCQCCRGYLGGCWKPGTPMLSFAPAFYC